MAGRTREEQSPSAAYTLDQNTDDLFMHHFQTAVAQWNPELKNIKIYDSKNIDEIVYITQEQAENMARELAEKEGIFSGPSSGGTTFVALEVAKKEKEAVIVSIICDRGDRYVSTGIFNK